MPPSPRFILDTNIISELMRNPSGSVRRRIAKEGEDSVAVSIVVAAELRFGAARRGSAKLTHWVDTILKRIPILPFEDPADRHYADLRASLERAGTPIGSNDLLIAAHCRALGLILVTANTAEFSKVRGLRLQNWLPKPKP